MELATPQDPEQPKPQTVEWPSAKVELVKIAARFTSGENVALTLACTDERCKADPLLKRHDVEPGVFLLVCHHLIRICRDAKRLKKAARRLRRERPSKAARKHAQQLAELNALATPAPVPDEKPTTLVVKPGE